MSSIFIRSSSLPQPRAMVLISPWVDLTLQESGNSPAMSTDFLVTFKDANPEIVEMFLPPEMIPSDPQVSPMLDDLNSLPPQLVFAGGAEVLLPDSKTWVRRSREAGNTVEFVLEEGQMHT